MLILELKEGESFRINDDIEVNFKSIKASHVKVAIHAPDKLKIQRIEPPFKPKEK
jgi:carbon storage regulator CsrA